MRQYHKLLLAGLVGLLVVGGVISGVIAYAQNQKGAVPMVFSNYEMLRELWGSSKSRLLEQGTYRTLDKSQDNITTSEGQSYTMLRAVWMDDRETFDRSWQWTKDNLQRDDKLMSWKFGRLPDGTYGVMDTVGGQNTASDADSDIALALLMAYVRWNDTSYREDARPIVSAMWEKQVVDIAGKPVLVANDLERLSDGPLVVNVSYFAPYAYKIFADFDTEHDWTALADNSYDVLNRAIDSKLDRDKSAGLPPDWVRMDRRTGAILPADGNLTTNYSFDALRTPFRLALDYEWTKDERAKRVLEKFQYLANQWQTNGKLFASYKHDGTPEADYETAAMYGGSIGYFKIVRPDLAKDIYQQKLVRLYDPDGQKWRGDVSYYDDNWAWFGIALMHGALPNLTDRS